MKCEINTIDSRKNENCKCLDIYCIALFYCCNTLIKNEKYKKGIARNARY